MSSDRRATAIHAELLEDRAVAAEVYALMIEDPRTEPILWASVVLSSQGLDRFGEYLEELDAAVRHPSEAPFLFPQFLLATEPETFAPHMRSVWRRIQATGRPLSSPELDPQGLRTGRR
jgi:hypothetical protein